MSRILKLNDEEIINKVFNEEAPLFEACKKDEDKGGKADKEEDVDPKEDKEEEIEDFSDVDKITKKLKLKDLSNEAKLELLEIIIDSSQDEDEFEDFVNKVADLVDGYIDEEEGAEEEEPAEEEADTEESPEEAAPEEEPVE